jgi:sulfur carrier protein
VIIVTSTNPSDSSSDSSSEIQLHLNGELRSCRRDLTLTEFLVELGLNPQLVAVEYNGEILARSQWPTTTLQADDALEIVTIVGGG